MAAAESVNKLYVLAPEAVTDASITLPVKVVADAAETDRILPVVAVDVT